MTTAFVARRPGDRAGAASPLFSADDYARMREKQSALGAPGTERDLAEQLRVYNEFLFTLNGPDGAKDQIDHIRRIVDSWWDFTEKDFDSCDPFASEDAPRFKNPSCKYWPHAGYLRYMPNETRPCLADRQPSLPGSGVARLEGETDQTAPRLDESEEAFYAQAGDGSGLDGPELERLHAIKVQLDQAYDLLHQRQGRRDAGEDPSAAELRPPEVVEDYRQ